MYDKKVTELSKYKDTHSSNASRILHAFVHRKGKTLPVPITPVQVPVRLPRRRKVVTRPWPVLLLSDWIKLVFEDSHYAGFFLLGGYKMDQFEQAKRIFKTFWERRAHVEQDVPPFAETTIPIALHGDEGRGAGKRPILVIGYQPVVPWAGENVVNSSKYFGFHGRCFSEFPFFF